MQLFPDLYRTRDAARQALDGLPPDWRPAVGCWPGVVAVRYRPAGKRCPVQMALAVAQHLDQVREWMTAILGPLAIWEPALELQAA